MSKIVKWIYNLRIPPRWLIICIDLFFICLSAFFAYLLRFNFSLTALTQHDFGVGILLQVAIAFIAIMITSSYKGIIRYTGVQDGVRIFYMLVLNLGLTCGFNLVYFYNVTVNLIPYSV